MYILLRVVLIQLPSLSYKKLLLSCYSSRLSCVITYYFIIIIIVSVNLKIFLEKQNTYIYYIYKIIGISNVYISEI